MRYRYKFEGYYSHRGEVDAVSSGIESFSGPTPVVNAFPAAFNSVKHADNYWWELVQSYSMRSLSVQSDRLLPISGVAESMQRSLASFFGPETRIHYLAGHWKHSLHRDLGWYSSPQNPLSARPLTYQGPSWSWLAVSTGIEIQDQSTWGNYEPVLHVMSTKAKLKEPSAPYGLITHAMITAKVYISCANLTRHNSRSFKLSRHRKAERGSKVSINMNHGQENHIYFDTTCDSLKDGETKEIFLVLLRQSYGKPEWGISALICSPRAEVDEKRSFVRMGLLMIDFGDHTVTGSEKGRDLQDQEWFQDRRGQDKQNREWFQGWDREVIQLL